MATPDTLAHGRYATVHRVPVQDPPTTKTISAADLLLLGLQIALAWTLVRYAWVGDDVFITLRTVDNFVRGEGLTWNPGIRVQVYTHPLWMFVLSGFYVFTREPFYTTIAASLLLTVLGTRLLTRWLCPSSGHALIALAILVSSRTFIDWSASGLENPLTFLLIVWFARAFYREHGLRQLVFIAALGCLNRLDTVLFFAPAIVWVIARSERGWKAIASDVVIGASPLVAWELFSLVYYGSFVPNTALAKLGHDYPQGAIVARGLEYLLDFAKRDPLSLLVMVVGLYLGVREKGQSRLLAFGALLYAMYVIWIGGDFMAMRFYYLPFVLGLLLLVQVAQLSEREGIIATFALLLFGWTAERPTLLPQVREPEGPAIGPWGIADERAYYAPDTSLHATGLSRLGPEHKWRRDGERMDSTPAEDRLRRVHLHKNLGFPGFYAPRDVVLFDYFALADPFLARLPARREVDWRIGHFRRFIPTGYEDTMETGEPSFADQALTPLWSDVALVTEGDLFSLERWIAIWELHTTDPLDGMDLDPYRYPGAATVAADQLGGPGETLEKFSQGGVFIEEASFPVDVVLTPGRYSVDYRVDGIECETAMVLTRPLPKSPKKDGDEEPKLHAATLRAPTDCPEGRVEVHLLPEFVAKKYFIAAESGDGKSD